MLVLLNKIVMVQFINIVVVVVLDWLSVSTSSVTECPHQTTGLLRWSEEATWNGNKPQENEDIFIDKPILLDEQPPLLRSISITPSGMLVWDPEADPIQLKVSWIDVEGEFHIGGDNCRFSNEARLTFVGNVADLDEFGKDKGLYVRENGVLEIHGDEKFPWTKLTETAPKREYIYFKQTLKGVDPAYDSGLMVYAIDPTTGQLIAEKYFNTNQKRRIYREKMVELKTFTDGLANDTIIGIAVLDKVVRNKRVLLHELADVVCELGYGNLTCPTRIAKDELVSYDSVKLSWVFLTQKGNYESTYEEYLQQSGITLLTEASTESNDIRVTISCYIDRGGNADYVKIYVTSKLDVGPKLSLVDDVSSWKIGDEIVIVSTDYDWRQAEVRKIVECNDCNNLQIRINEPLIYTHYGKIYKSVDMRGEVALLTRNIRIDSEDAEESDEYGGHIRILKDFKSAHVQGAELVNLGASQVLGRYSLHLHMCHDVYGRQLFRQNSIHHANTRCVTIHGTHNATVSENVCFMTKGHGYFLEDGGERDTYFYGNIGLGQEIGSLIPTDRSPSTFWITNPNTRMINNVAAGAEGKGFWFLWPRDLPLGPSRDLGFMMEVEGRYSQLKGFKHNVAHSNKNGLFMDNRLMQDGTTKMYMMWRPKEDPVQFLLYSNSSNKPALVEYFTGYKNSKNNVWIRVGAFMLRHISTSDSLRGVALVRQSGDVPVFEKSVVIGISDNLGEPTRLSNGEEYERSVPNPSEPERPQIGWLIVKKPTPVNSVWFDDYRNTSLYAMSALGYRLRFHMATKMAHRMSNLQFGFDDPDEGNRVFNFPLGHPYYSHQEAELTKSFQDVDGSVVGIPNKTFNVVYPIPFHLTPACITRPSWYMAYCPEPIGHLVISLTAEFSGSTFDEEDDSAETVAVENTSDNSFIITRDEDHENLWKEISFSHNIPVNVFLDRSHSYTVRFTTAFPPDKVHLGARMVSKSDYVRIGMCIPRNTTYEMRKQLLYKEILHTSSLTPVSGLNELDEDEMGDKYFHDNEVGYFAILLRHMYDFGPEDVGNCPENKCVFFEMYPNLTNADPTDVNCLPRLYAKYSVEDLTPKNGQPVVPVENNIDDRMLPHTSREPPSSWGAGPSLTPRKEYSSGIY